MLSSIRDNVLEIQRQTVGLGHHSMVRQSLNERQVSAGDEDGLNGKYGVERGHAERFATDGSYPTVTG